MALQSSTKQEQTNFPLEKPKHNSTFPTSETQYIWSFSVVAHLYAL